MTNLAPGKELALMPSSQTRSRVVALPYCAAVGLRDMTLVSPRLIFKLFQKSQRAHPESCSFGTLRIS